MQRKQEAGAGSAYIKSEHRFRQSQVTLQQARQRGHQRISCNCGRNNHANFGRGNPGHCDGLFCCLPGNCQIGLPVCKMPVFDSGPGANPCIIGIHDFRHVIICYGLRRDTAACAAKTNSHMFFHSLLCSFQS